MAYYDRLAIDDLGVQASPRKYGLTGSVIHYYQNWSGRFAFVWIMMLLTRLYEITKSLLPYFLLLISSYFIVFYRGFVLLLKPLITSKQDHFLSANLVFFVFAIFVVSNYEFNTFFWFCASVGYFGGVLFACLGALALFSPSKSPFSFLLLIVSFIFVGSAVENMAFVFIVLLSAYSFVQILFANKHFTWLAHWIQIPTTFLHQVKTAIAWVISVVSFLISILAPGNRVRLGSTKSAISLTYGEILWEIRKNIPHFFHDFLPSNFVYFYWLIFVMLYIGTHFRTKNSLQEDKLVLRLAVAFPLLILLLLCCILPNIYATVGIGAGRTLIIAAFLLIVFVSYFAFQIGYATLFSKKLAFTLAFFSVLTFLYDAKFRWINETYGAKIYAREYDQQINYLLELKAKKNTKAIGLPPLTYPPASLMYHKLSTDSSNWVNMHFVRNLELGFDVYLSD
jgi:hypothetical protein